MYIPLAIIVKTWYPSGMKKSREIPIIDIFAGPGGLGEGFSAAKENIAFSTKLSIEKDEVAHQTLLLRSFLRSFGYDNFPKEYYEYITNPDYSRQQLFNQYPEHAEKARHEAWQLELGPKNSEIVHKRISKALSDADHWVLLGGPPCQAYSLVGRARMTGVGTSGRELSAQKQEHLKNEKLKVFHEDHRHVLYKEYLKIVAAHKPTIFVMENVKGILSAKHGEDPIFETILSDLRDPWTAIANDPDLKKDIYVQAHLPRIKQKYKLFSFVTGSEPGKNARLDPRDFIIRSEEYGIPQRRHRVIILGVLDEYEVKPEALKKVDKPVTVQQAIGDLPKLRSGLSKEKDSHEAWYENIIKGFPASILDRMKEKEISSAITKALNSVKTPKSRGGKYVTSFNTAGDTEYKTWISSDKKLKGITLHETRGHMGKDLWRYLYAAAFSKTKGYSPSIQDFPKRLHPDHKNVNTDGNAEIHFKDRFKVQIGEQPATTITSHISKDGHYYIHYDPAQCRSLTVREAARLQTFPDNYYFEGNRTQQYHQVGNAVPPLLARKLAHIVSEIMEQCLEKDRTGHISDSSNKKEKARA